MTDKKWIDVGQLKEFYNVLSTQDLIELSMCSRLFRSKLIRVIYKILELSYSKMNNFGYKSYLITKEDSEYNDKDIQDRIEDLMLSPIYGIYYMGDEEIQYSIDFFTNPYKPLTEKFIASRERFQSDLKLIPYQPSELTICNFRHCYIIRELSNAFNSLKTLYIEFSNVALEDLQYLLDNLECLEELRFTNNYIFKYKLESADSSIRWPQTLKKLVIGCNKEMLVHNKHDPIHIVPLDDDFDLPTTQLLLFPIHLPNLESLSLEYREEKFDGKLEFLKDNPHNKKLSLPFVEEIPRVFDTIKSFNNLEHLDIFTNCLGYSKELQSNNFPTPCNLKSLTLECFYYPHIIQFVKSFHRITNLKVKTLHIHFNEIIQFINELSDFQLLKNLSLCFVLTSCELEEAKDSKVYMPFKTNNIKLPKLGNLEKVEFKLVSRDRNYIVKMDPSQVKFRIDECPKLKYIGFKSERNLEFISDIGLEKLELRNNWKLISTSRRYLLTRG